MDEVQASVGSGAQGIAAGKRRRGRLWLWAAVAVVVLVVGGLAFVCVAANLLMSSGTVSSWGLGDAVAVIYIEGDIGLGSVGTIGVVNTERVLGYIKQAESDSRIKAIVVFVNSPGGTVVPADQMYHALRDAAKPVVAVLGDVAASGGYYVACGADKIVAHPATITGSIGVYGQMINAADLLDKLGVEGIIIRSGDVKAAGNWFEHPTPEQIAVEQSIVDELYALFVGVVADSRGMEEARVRELADGRPYTGQQALALGLVDSLGGMQDGIAEAATMSGIEGTPQVIEYRYAPSLLDLWLGARSSSQSEQLFIERFDSYVVLPQMRYVTP
jgi:protease-4